MKRLLKKLLHEIWFSLRGLIATAVVFVIAGAVAMLSYWLGASDGVGAFIGIATIFICWIPVFKIFKLGQKKIN